ncbi:MAG: Gfo/Idh/MocA family oxidoreductase [Bacteroidia bacterium]|nr:Gfo/Idh/MocA family oxidoreductase [Bacteroidia bacterium]MDW8302083.1 Gfo/Idh/MocA family oxidoreductase [Bacteroidia bacterium]
MSEQKLKIGVVGAGHLGKIHINCIKQIPSYELVGFYDIDENTAQEVSKKLNVPHFDTLEALIANIDVLDVVVPTLYHYACAVQAIQAQKHVFIEKPFTTTLQEAQSLIELALAYKVKIQVGHVERFNPAFLAVQSLAPQPLFIESHRLAQFNPRGTDVSVVLDLMIHDIDVIQSMIPSKVIKVDASGVAVVSETPDIVNARITFENGAVANVTASRISLKNMRKMRLFQQDAYITMDFLEKKAEIFQLKNMSAPDARIKLKQALEKGEMPENLHYETLPTPPVNAIKMELETFYEAIIQDTKPVVDMYDGYRALETAFMVIDNINKHLSSIKV